MKVDLDGRCVVWVLECLALKESGVAALEDGHAVDQALARHIVRHRLPNSWAKLHMDAKAAHRCHDASLAADLNA